MPDEVPAAPASTPPAAPPAAVPTAAVVPVAAPPAPVAPPAPAAAIAPVVPTTNVPAPAAPAAPAEKPDAATEMANRLRSLELRTVVAETGLDPKLTKFITATDEAGMKAQAEELKAAMGANTPAAPAAGTPPPAAAPAAGTVTNPPAGTTLTLDERISAAEKSGKVGLSIQLKRERAGLPV